MSAEPTLNLRFRPTWSARFDDLTARKQTFDTASSASRSVARRFLSA
jgi:hypothetical protein